MSWLGPNGFTRHALAQRGKVVAILAEAAHRNYRDHVSSRIDAQLFQRSQASRLGSHAIEHDDADIFPCSSLKSLGIALSFYYGVI
jgi:hypothetical protein